MFPFASGAGNFGAFLAQWPTLKKEWRRAVVASPSRPMLTCFSVPSRADPECRLGLPSQKNLDKPPIFSETKRDSGAGISSELGLASDD